MFLSDKKKLKEYGSAEPLNRIKKEFLKEVKTMAKGERVLIVGASSEPFLCVKKDQKSLVEFFQKHVHCPLPDYASRRQLWWGRVAGGVDGASGRLNPSNPMCCYFAFLPCLPQCTPPATLPLTGLHPLTVSP